MVNVIAFLLRTVRVRVYGQVTQLNVEQGYQGNNNILMSTSESQMVMTRNYLTP